MTTSKPGYIPPPNYTQCPNVFYDEIMPEIETMAELKVTLAIIRQTFGWQKKEDQISFGQLEELTGMHRETVSEGIQAALKRGYVGRRKQGKSYVYGLRVTGRNIRPMDSRNIRPTKEREKESITNTNVFEGKAQTNEKVQKIKPLDKDLTDRMYDAWKAESFPRWTQETYGYHLGRVQQLLRDVELTDSELERLPYEFVKYYVGWNPKADAVSTLTEMRRRDAREKEPPEQDARKGPRKSEEQLAREDAERQEELRIMAEVMKRGGPQ